MVKKIGYIRSGKAGEYWLAPDQGTTPDREKAWLYSEAEFRQYANSIDGIAFEPQDGPIPNPAGDVLALEAVQKAIAALKAADDPKPVITEPVPWATYVEMDPEIAKHALWVSHGNGYISNGCLLCANIAKYLKDKGLKIITDGSFGTSQVVPLDWNAPAAKTKTIGDDLPEWLTTTKDDDFDFGSPYPYMSPKTMTTLEKLRTQKARGVYALSHVHSPFPCYSLDDRCLYNFDPVIFPHKSNLPALPCFARPCPTVPRHGFVDSRLVSDHEQAFGVVAETLRADPNGEVIFMKRLHGDWSGIITHAGVNFGMKNDGATSGASVKTIPSYSTPSRFRYAVGENLLDRAGVKGTPYVEFVEDDNRVVFVQLRDGPEVPRARNYIPAKTTVAKVMYAVPSLDLLEWEERVTKMHAKYPEGLVVHHPGGALTSHFAVHALMHKIPVILDDKAPQIGDVLEPTGWEPESLKAADYRKIAERIAKRLHHGFGRMDFHGARAAVHTAVATLHASPQWGREQHLLDLRADGIAATLSFTTAACLGELRHWYGSGPGTHCDVPTYYEDGTVRSYDYRRPTCELFQERNSEDGARTRERVYEDVLVKSAPKLHRWAKQAAEDLGASGWNRGYGGKGWAKAAKTAAEGFEAVERFIRHPTAKRWAVVMTAYNRVINAAHNNGNILNKWIGQEAMNHIAEIPGPSFVNPFAARVVLQLDTLPELHHGLDTVPLLEGQDVGTPINLNIPAEEITDIAA